MHKILDDRWMSLLLSWSLGIGPSSRQQQVHATTKTTVYKLQAVKWIFFGVSIAEWLRILLKILNDCQPRFESRSKLFIRKNEWGKISRKRRQQGLKQIIGSFQTITADLMMTSLAVKGKLIQFLSDDSEETDDVTIFIDVMRGRINLSVLSRERWLIVRFDGWPEVSSLNKIQ